MGARATVTAAAPRPASTADTSTPPVALTVIAVGVWVLVAVRAIPGLSWDRGVFVSVAERLAAGDRLYVEVWDNKDPLFYYLLAVGRLVHPWADVVVELGWVVLAAAAMASVCRSSGCDRAAGFTVGWIATPLLLTSSFYVAGYTNLPGTAVTLAIVAAALRDRWLLAGAGLGLLGFVKIVNVPVAVVLVAIVVAARGQGRVVRLLAAGVAGSAAAMVAVLALRGELGGYVSMLRSNVAYAGGAGSDHLLSHLSRVATDTAIWTSLLLVGVLVWGLVAVRTPGEARLLVHLAWSAAVSVLLVLSLTGMWDHHMQLAYVVGCLVMAMVARQIIGMRGIVAVMLLAVVLGGVTAGKYVNAMRDAGPGLRALVTVSPQAQAVQVLTTPGSYARFGSNEDDGGHAAGLRRWTLACPAFHQYPFDPAQRLTDHRECLQSAEYILVSASGAEWLAADRDRSTDFGRYVDDVRKILVRDYRCQEMAGVRVCRRPGG